MKFFPIIVLLSVTFAVHAQTRSERCVKNHNAPPINSYYWPPDAEVKVYFLRDMFTREQQRTLFAAMESWNAVASESGARVKFLYAGEVDRTADCQSCLTVTRREVHKQDRKHYAFFNPLRLDGDGLLVSAWIDFDFATTSPEALQGYMAHELGHGMGLWDCTTCKKRKTIMNGFPGVNRNNGLIQPSNCDVEVVKEIYQLHRRVANNIVTEKPF